MPLALALVAVLAGGPAAAQAPRQPSQSIIVATDGGPAAGSAVRAQADGPIEQIGPRILVVQVPDAAAAIDALQHHPGIRYAEPDHPLYATATPPDDTYFGLLWGLHNTGQSGGTPGADIEALAAWDHLDTLQPSTVVVGVTDSGIDATHPDLTGRMWRNSGALSQCPTGATGFDFVTGVCASGSTDGHGHGTHVAGTIGAAIGNSTGVAGVAPNAQLLDLRFMDATGAGSTSGAVAAITMATDLAKAGVSLRVINASWGGDSDSSALRQAISDAGAAGIVVVTTAGNVGRDIDVLPFYPCSYNLANVVCVGASGRTDARASYTNYGATSVDLAAPGTAIMSTWPGGSYQYLDGTSMAAPHVAGVVAMLAGTCATSPAAAKAALLAGVDPVTSFQGLWVTAGRLNGAGSLASACAGRPGAPGPALLGPSNQVVSWVSGGGQTFLLERRPTGASTWSAVGPASSEPQADLSTLPEGRMDLRVVGDVSGRKVTSSTTAGVVIDRSEPTVSISGCPTQEVSLGAALTVTVAAGDAWSGLAQDPSGVHSLDTTSAGTLIRTFTALDRVGLSRSVDCTYSVLAQTSGGGGTSGGDGGGGGGLPTAPLPTAPLPDEPVDPEEGGGFVGGAIEAPRRIASPDATTAAVQISALRFGDAGTMITRFATWSQTPDPPEGPDLPQAAHAVLARDDEFADAMAGASLSGAGPLLLTSAESLDSGVAAELQRILPDGGVVYLLGGERALPAAIADQVRSLGFAVRRLAGPTRVETALQVADAVVALASGTSSDVLVARAHGPQDNPTAAWADAISAGAHGARTTTPVVLTAGESLHPAVAEWIRASGRRPVLLGGEAALTSAVAGALPGAERVAGPDRAATAAAVAGQLWGQPAPLAAAVVINGWHDRGWAFGLAAAGLAADVGAPLLLVGGTVPPATAALLGCATAGGPGTRITVLGDEDVVSLAVQQALDVAAAC
ncbi:MAG: S8 family serine peptidase [Euzebya sp.]